MTRDWKEQSYLSRTYSRDRHTAPRPPLQQQVPLTPLWKDQQGLHPLEAQRGHPAVCKLCSISEHAPRVSADRVASGFPFSLVSLHSYPISCVDLVPRRTRSLARHVRTHARYPSIHRTRFAASHWRNSHSPNLQC